MEIKTKFNFGDKVQQIWFNSIKEYKPCAFCGDSRRIEGKDESTRLCPECYGNGGSNVEINKEWSVRGELTIGEVRIEWCGEYNPDFDSDFDNYGPQTESLKEVYMCYETGIGSGTLWPVEKLFHTEEEAQAECGRLNATTLE